MKSTFITAVAAFLLTVSLSACATRDESPATSLKGKSNIAGRTLTSSAREGGGATLKFEENGELTFSSTMTILYGMWGVESDGRHWVQFPHSRFNPNRQYFEVKDGQVVFLKR